MPDTPNADRGKYRFYFVTLRHRNNTQHKITMNRKRQLFALIIIGFALIALLFFEEKKPEKHYFADSGVVFGTTYHITYESDTALTAAIRRTFAQVDNSLSMFNEHSTISAINRNDTAIVCDSLFRRVFDKSMEISAATDGAFDITVAPLVNAWGFGFKNSTLPTRHDIDSLMQIIGYRKVSCDENGRIHKNDPRIMLDCGAIAKGFGCDMVAETLKANGVENYIVEIGGEVAVNGHNAKGQAWRIGINKPTDDSLSVSNEIEQIANLTHGGMATSGNYRNFYIRDGKKYAHTIDPKSGYPIQHKLLSATIIADDCMTADAYATACMVVGLEQSLQLCRANGLQGFFIYSDNEEIKTAQTADFPLTKE